MEKISEIHKIIDLLSRPVSDQELRNGWTDMHKANAAKAFQEVLAKIKEREEVPYFGLIRALDFNGVSEGDLLEKIAAVENLINSK